MSSDWKKHARNVAERLSAILAQNTVDAIIRARERAFSEALFGNRSEWDLRQLRDIAGALSMSLSREADKALRCIQSGQIPHNIEVLCRELLPMLEDERWKVAAHPEINTTIMVRLDKLASDILHRYLDHLSDECRATIEPRLVLYDL
jgi:hypothetical protein